MVGIYGPGFLDWVFQEDKYGKYSYLLGTIWYNGMSSRSRVRSTGHWSRGEKGKLKCIKPTITLKHLTFSYFSQ